MTALAATATVKGLRLLKKNTYRSRCIFLTLKSGNQCLYYRPNIIHCKCDIAAGYKLHEGKCVLDEPNPNLCNPGASDSADDKPDTCGAGQCVYNDPVSHLKK